MTISEATNREQWDTFLTSQRFRPFLQSWTMGEVYRAIGQEPIRLETRDGKELKGICLAIVVPAKRGRHLAIQHGPLLQDSRFSIQDSFQPLLDELIRIAKDQRCSFIRMSPFWPTSYPLPALRPRAQGREATRYPLLPSPLHLLAEHIWYLPLVLPNQWEVPNAMVRRAHHKRTEEEILKSMRKTTRNLIRRAEHEGVTVRASTDPDRDLHTFLTLHDETRRRHKFVPYTDQFIREQVLQFSERNEATLYLAECNGEVIASSIHMHVSGETSYHHGASSSKHPKVPASHLLQWTAIKDALARGDHIYNFWGIAALKTTNYKLQTHPFAGVTIFKTGFGGSLLELQHCMDIPISPSYHITRAFETIRKWRRGF